MYIQLHMDTNLSQSIFLKALDNERDIDHATNIVLLTVYRRDARCFPCESNHNRISKGGDVRLVQMYTYPVGPVSSSTFFTRHTMDRSHHYQVPHFKSARVPRILSR